MQSLKKNPDMSSTKICFGLVKFKCHFLFVRVETNEFNQKFPIF